MRVPEQILKCVAFLGYQNAAGEFKFIGTGFFAGRRVFPDDQIHFRYLVTARHVIEGVRKKGLDKVLVRLNRRDGKPEWFGTNQNAWYGHSMGEAVDVAIMHIPPGFPWDEVDHQWLPFHDMLATPEVLREQGVEVGAELAITGLFRHHIGKSRNIPIVRIGNIAAMPHEPIATQIGFIEAYLIESRSTAGLSGSPVFVHIPHLRRDKGGALEMSVDPYGVFYLLGLMFGHFDDKSDLIEDSISGPTPINVGIGIVVPATKILEIIQEDPMKSHEEISVQKALKRRTPTADVLDGQHDETGSTKKDFESRSEEGP